MVRNLLDIPGNVLVLAAAFGLVMQGRNNLGGIIDSTIVALAIGGVLWDVVLVPNLVPEYQASSSKVALCVAVFSLCGVLGVLAQLVIQHPVPA